VSDIYWKTKNPKTDEGL